MPWHMTPESNIKSICREGLKPRIGPRSEMLGEDAERVYLFSSFSDFMSSDSWLFDAFDEDERLAIFHVNVPAQQGAWTEIEDSIPASALTLICADIDFLSDSPAYAAIDSVSDPFGTLEDFRATRTHMSAQKFGKLVGDDQWENDSSDFFVYGASFYIAAMSDGSYHLPLVSDTYVADTYGGLPGLEEKLFEYMISEKTPPSSDINESEPDLFSGSF